MSTADVAASPEAGRPDIDGLAVSLVGGLWHPTRGENTTTKIENGDKRVRSVRRVIVDSFLRDAFSAYTGGTAPDLHVRLRMCNG
jgi:hypothetical protein